MAKFCGKCGHKLDENTGLCPVCNKDEIAREIVSDEASEPSKHNEQTYTQQKVKLTRKQKREQKKAEKKAEKARIKASRTFGQKVKRFFVKLLVIILGLAILFGAGLGALVYHGIVDVPVVSGVIGDLGSDEPEYVGQSSKSCYTPDEDNIIYKDAEKSFGYVNNMVLVFFSSKADAQQIEEVVDSINGEVVGTIDGVNQYQIRIEPTTEENLQTICNQLLSFDAVKYAMIDCVFTTTLNETPNDPWRDIIQGSSGVDWNENEPSGTNWWFEATKIPSAWEYSNKFTNIRVGVVDNGYDTTHEDLNINVLNSDVNMAENHGTHVAGVIGATVNNNTGISGVLKDKTLYGVDCYATSKQEKQNIAVSSLGGGIDLCIQNNCKVINMSSGTKYTKETETKNASAESARNAVRYLIFFLDTYGNDFIVVHSAGNGNYWGSGINAKDFNGWFSGIDEALVQSVLDEYKRDGVKFDNPITVQDVMDSFMVVAAVDEKKKNGEYQLSSFSNYGDAINVCAPGVNVFSTIKMGGINGSYGYMDGTSMAAPIVSGITSLTWSIDQTMTSGEVKQIIIETATQRVLSRKRADNGSYFMIDAEAAVKKAIEKSSGNTGQTDDSGIHEENEKPIRTTSDERDIVLVLDASGSMAGEPMEETKDAATKFVQTILKEDASIGIVTYDDEASMPSDFSTNESHLVDTIDNIDDGGGTNIEAGLRTADQMLSSSNAKKKIIVLMSDGMPNDGLQDDELIAYSDELKEKGIYIYTLGFFNEIGNKSSAQYLMEGIASEGCHYEVSDAESLVFFFGDIADQINGQKYIYVRIACPVDVKVTYDGETLDSSESGLSTRTNFGTLTFEDTAGYESYSDYDEELEDSTVKILRLKEGVPYDINIQGTGRGRMNYSIGFMDENGEYSDFRRFSNIRISNRTSINTVAEVSDSTTLKVDEDGDGRYDITYKAKANEYGKEVNYTFMVYTILSLVVALVLLIFVLVMYKKLKKRRKYNG